MSSEAGKGGGARKYGRNSGTCLTYRNQDRQSINALRRLVRHFKKYKLWNAATHSPYVLDINTSKHRQPHAMQKWGKLMAVLPNSTIKRIVAD
jgi:G:T/U-mismatch repair DNA glycosylase